MIYFTSKNGQHFMILEPGNLDRLQAGEPLKTPDGKIVVLFTPDMPWTMKQLEQIFARAEKTMTPAEFDRILKEGMKRPEVRDVEPPANHQA